MTELGSKLRSGDGLPFGPLRFRLVSAGDPTADLEIFAALGGTIAIAVALLLPLETVAGFLGGCRFKSAIGLPCMTCGATRALAALSRLEILAALRLQPLVASAAIVAALYTPIAWVSWLLRLPRLRIGSSSRRAFWALLVAGAAAILVNWAYLMFDGR